MRHPTPRWLLAAAALLTMAGCGASAAPPSGGTGSTTTLATMTIGSHGPVVVAGSNSMTLYWFDMDTPGSGTAACTGSCVGTWPPLTVSAGTTPSAASGITGPVATVTRADGKGTQVTYNGRLLYFFSGDTKPGDTNGNYPGWHIALVSAGAATGATPTPTSSSGGYAYP